MINSEELDKKVQEVIELKQNLPLGERLEYLFEEIDEVCQELDKRSMEFYSQLDFPEEKILDYYSKYNLTKRLLIRMSQANTATMEYLQPEFFKKCGDKKQRALVRCLKCNVNLLDGLEVSQRMCQGCLKTAE
jgi:hypothetical protein|tara:strand:+ start:534 stop:932 length:399 start_codon:yes stop_codon:yes gene_type:complete